MKIYNTNDMFGDCGPFEAASFEALADEMDELFREWTGNSNPEELAKVRLKFIEGLEEVQS